MLLRYFCSNILVKSHELSHDLQFHNHKQIFFKLHDISDVSLLQ